MVYGTRLRKPSYLRWAGLRLAAVGFPVDTYEESVAADVVDELLRLASRWDVLMSLQLFGAFSMHVMS